MSKNFEFLKQIKEFYAAHQKSKEAQEKIEVDGFKVSKKLLNRESLNNCPVCNSFSKGVKDDICLIKYECCNNCFIQYVDGREDRWLKGWRPNENNKVTT